MSTISEIPKTMTGVQVAKVGGPEVLEYKTDLPVPVPKEGQVLVKNEFIGINFIDTYFRSGLYPSPKPEILGRESSGTVVTLGEGNTYGLKVGDRVAFIGTAGYAGFTAAPAQKTIKLPNEISTESAAAVLLQGLTAVSLIREAYNVQKGDWILVHAASGGMGIWLCQLLKAVGANIIATASTEAKRALAKKNGAGYAFGYEEDALIEEIMKLTGGNGVRAIFDGVGKATFQTDLKCIARKGSLVSFGNASGPVDPVPLTVLTVGNIRLMRPKMDNYIYTREEFEHYSNELFEFMIKDNIEPQKHETYPLKDVARAHTSKNDWKTIDDSLENMFIFGFRKIGLAEAVGEAVYSIPRCSSLTAVVLLKGPERTFTPAPYHVL